MTLSQKQYKKIRSWMYRNARPIDLARWQFHFENGSDRQVLEALHAYQNSDGGFGHGLEPDCWNKKSSPMQTWAATEILFELGIQDGTIPLIQGILAYLNSGDSFKDGFWLAQIPSNNISPRAPWWTFTENVVAEWGYNPTISLCGFILRYEQKGSGLYSRAVEIAGRAVEKFVEGPLLDSMHEVGCYSRFYDYVRPENGLEWLDKAVLENRLKAAVDNCLTQDTRLWYTDYVCRPSFFMRDKGSIYSEDNRDLIKKECDFLIETLQPDGSWPLNWAWQDYPQEWALSKNWWTGAKNIEYMMFLNGFDAVSS